MIFVLYTISILAIIGTFLPKFDIEHWIVRGQAYFRGVYLGLNVLMIILLLVFAGATLWTFIMIAGLIAAVIVCLQSILPFTSLGKIQVPSAKESSTENTLNLLIYNVYQYNTEYQKLLDLVEEVEPDIIFLIETSVDWAKGLSSLKEKYNFHLNDVRENTYGLMLYSKLELLEGGINYLVKQEIPSAEILIKKNNVMVRILGIHPKPPVLGEAETSRSKDRELIQAARYLNAQVEDDHQILIGDLNDVAWSRASLAFKKMTGMKDPRAGRGFYPTFPTWSPIKIPLDHVFCSSGLELVDFKVLENIGSDHFPVNVIFKIPE
ncbi:endonuclease/exonuclease/phosphatase family protein [Portibacter lacus]|uniref:Endonuclease n=1 Tax=Portibacter lacus TaxID=1099794 RepID=A0AA37WE32_9BACT|nr:endonuclease/exonuclease/phosphatase family protein [Portibacter lacus]GLR15720.1 endonuclease [Portibacter lacus]